MRVSPCIGPLLASLLVLSAVAAGRRTPKLSTSLRNPCETPSLPAGAIHIVIAAYEEHNCFSNSLWDLGLTNANVYVYRRVAPERPLSVWHGPCGMTVHERLLLPNQGLEFAAFYDYILEHYANPPHAMLLLHGHGPQALPGKDPHMQHSNCSSVVGRARFFYRGLAGAQSSFQLATTEPFNITHGAPMIDIDAAEFSKHMITLTRPAQVGDVNPLMHELHWDTGSPATRKLQTYYQDVGDRYNATCRAFFKSWSVPFEDVGGFRSCCAQFILPWERIRWYPVGYYEALRKHSQQLKDWEDQYYYSIFCWEYVIWSWYKEPAVTPSMLDLYKKASQLGEGYDLKRCTASLKSC